METLKLNGSWTLLERPLHDGPATVTAVLASEGWIPASVPGDVNDALVQSGRLPEPLTGINFEQFAFVQDRSWWWKKEFTPPPCWQKKPVVELSLDGLDVHADLWLNGKPLGHHPSAFRPFTAHVQDAIRWDAPNTLLVRLTCGRECVPPDADPDLLSIVPTEESRGFPNRGFPGRIYLRKPAFVWGWDFSPPLATCGITQNAEIRALEHNEIRDIHLSAAQEDGNAHIKACIEIERQTLLATCRASLQLRLTDEDGNLFSVEKKDVLLRSGYTHVDLQIHIPAIRCWWPHGSGPQHRYSVEAQLTADDQTVTTRSLQWGARTLRMISSPGLFGFEVNGTPIFLQGGNWAPPDALCGRITPGKLTRLVEEAAQANFNCLRVWGGGRYEDDAFYDACDRHGILVWHDFMSACAPLPADHENFRREFLNEAEHQIRRLRNHPCLLLWCGNNEVGGCYEWFAEKFAGRRDPAWELYFQALPRLITALSPATPYWPTSPYGGALVGDANEGDDHHWVVMRPEKEYWSAPEYWDEPGRSIFNSEYGYGGPCCIETTRQYLGTQNPDLSSATGREHTNAFYDIPRVRFSIRQHYADPDGLSVEDYILYGGLCQGLNLGYSLESLRANEKTLGGLFWMYTDTWGENGWSIIDYYLRRKIAYYNVRRCLAPQRLVLRPGGMAFGGKTGEVLLLALNDGPEPLHGDVRTGYFAYDGSRHHLEPFVLDVPPRSRKVVAHIPTPSADALPYGTLAAIPENGLDMDTAIWRHCRFRETVIPVPRVEILKSQTENNNLAVTVSSRTFAHAVHFNIPGDFRLSDHYFDLLPGEVRTLRIFDGATLAGLPLTARGLGSLHP